MQGGRNAACILVKKVGWLLEFYILEMFMVISRRVATCDSACSWWLYSAASLGNQAPYIMIQISHLFKYPDTELTGPCPRLLILSAWLESDRYRIFNSLV